MSAVAVAVIAFVAVTLSLALNVGAAVMQHRQDGHVRPVTAAYVVLTAVLSLFWLIVLAVRYA